MLALRGDGSRALQQVDIESAEPIFDRVAGQILSRSLNELLLLSLTNGMDRSADRVGSTCLDLDNNSYLTVFSHSVQLPLRRTQIAGHDPIPLAPQILRCRRFPCLATPLPGVKNGH